MADRHAGGPALPLHLPPLASLRIFDAAARHSSFRKAAAELNVTPSAVSHGIAALEKWLGTSLFLRDGRNITLTAEGEVFRPYVSDALSMIAIGAKRVSPLQEARRVSMTVAPTFASQWLVPRLRGFQSEHPEITLRIDSSHSQILFPRQDVDLAIRMGAAPLPNAHSILLFRETLIPVASPKYLETVTNDDGSMAWELAILIHLGSVSQDWSTWIDKQGVELHPAGQIVLDTVRLAMDAAAAGLGVALAREPVCTPELSRGDVVSLGFRPIPIETGYGLAIPAGLEPRRDVRPFLRWLCSEAGCIDELTSLQ